MLVRRGTASRATNNSRREEDGSAARLLGRQRRRLFLSAMVLLDVPVFDDDVNRPYLQSLALGYVSAISFEMYRPPVSSQSIQSRPLSFIRVSSRSLASTQSLASPGPLCSLCADKAKGAPCTNILWDSPRHPSVSLGCMLGIRPREKRPP